MILLKKYKIDKSKLVNPLSISSVKEFCKNLVSMKGKPSKIAFGLALGIFIGILIPVGFQMLIAIPLAVFFNVNIIVTVTATFITNPVTVVPLYFAIIKIGEFITQIKISWKKIEMLIENPDFDHLVSLGSESLIVFFSGSFILGILISTAIYFITLKLICRYRSKNQLECE